MCIRDRPFGCLPNHIVGKGMIRKIKNLYPQANIVPIDYDPGATRVNQENRIKLMLAVAREEAPLVLEKPMEAAISESDVYKRQDWHCVQPGGGIRYW